MQLQRFKPYLTVAALGVIAWIAPKGSWDPWHLVSPKEVARMLFALAFIQTLGALAAKFLGTRTGAIFTGFTGGLVSSTATTASLAKRSKTNEHAQDSSEILVFLAATGAMLIEGLGLALTGTHNWHVSVFLVFLVPLFATIAMILLQYRKAGANPKAMEIADFRVLPLLKLGLFIVIILTLSRVAQSFFGENGLLTLTFLVSLFEIHGSVIANLQLHETGAISVGFLTQLLALSIVASYLSKLVLISTIGSRRLRKQVILCTCLLFLSLLLSLIFSRFGLSAGS